MTDMTNSSQSLFCMLFLISLSLVSACALFGFQINWLWSQRIWRGLKLWDTADRIMWIWSRFIQKRFSVVWWTWLNERLLRRCGWVYVTPALWASGSGWVERLCAIRTGLQGTAHQRRTVKTQWDLEQFSLEEISAGSAVLNTTNSTSSAADIKSERYTDHVRDKMLVCSFNLINHVVKQWFYI